jgi:hypothetical protein
VAHGRSIGTANPAGCRGVAGRGLQRHRGQRAGSVQTAVGGRPGRGVSLHGARSGGVDSRVAYAGRAGAASRPSGRRSLHVCAAGATGPAGRKVPLPYPPNFLL